MKNHTATTLFGLARGTALALLVGTLLAGPSLALAATNTAQFGIGAAPSTASNTVTLFSADISGLQLFKRAFLDDGTPIADSTTLPIGTTVKFMIYIDNYTAASIDDLNIADALAGFTYTAGTIKMSTTLPNCLAGDGTCTVAEEGTMFTTLNGLAALNDDVSTANDAAGFSGGTISAGSTAGNQALDMLPNQAWGLLFTTTIN